MRRILLLVLAIVYFMGPLKAQQPNPSARITIETDSISVGALLDEVSRQAQVDFAYNSSLVDEATILSVALKDASLEEALQVVTKEFGLAYTWVEGQVVLHYPEGGNQQFTLSGYISDAATGENLIGATIAVKGTRWGTMTNEYGYFALPLDRGGYELSVSYLGYELLEQELQLNKDLRRDISLSPLPVRLPEIIVSLPPRTTVQGVGSDPGKIIVVPEQLNNLPEFGGESGLVKGLQSLPGIQAHGDGSAFFYTRGGERDQNLIIIDDAPIYNPSHMLGFYSLVIPDFTKQVAVYKSDIPASMGDRLASIVSIRTKDGNQNKAELSGALNPLVNRLTASFPLFKKKSALFISARRSNFEWIYQNFASTAQIGFWDFHMKWNIRINENNRLYFTTIQGNDLLSSGTNPVGSIRWGNSASTLRWNHIFGPKLFANTVLNSGNYAYNLNVATNFWKSELGTLSLKTDFTHYISPGVTANFGAQIQGYYTNPGELSLEGSVGFLPNIGSDRSRKGVLYYQSTWNISRKWQLNAGLRYITWSNLGPKTYYEYDENYQPADTINVGAGIYHWNINLDPRLSLVYRPDSTQQFKISFGNYHQYLQLVQNSISPFTAFEVWLPAGPTIEPQAATQIALNYQKELRRPGLTLSAATYFRSATNQIDYEAHPTTYLNPFLEGELRFGISRAYGIELMLQKQFGRLNGWVKYSYARVFRKTEGLNNEQWYPAFQDRPHDFSLVLNYDLSKRVRFTTFWVSHSGSAFTTPVGFYTFNDQTIPLYGDRNNDRLPAYHRVDIALRFRLNRRDNARFQNSLTFSIYNALAHPNIYNLNFNKRFRNTLGPPAPANFLSEEALSPSQTDLIRFFPSLTYKFKI
jgi:hypothetical protein